MIIHMHKGREFWVEVSCCVTLGYNGKVSLVNDTWSLLLEEISIWVCGYAGARVWVLHSHTHTRLTRWIQFFPIYKPMGIYLSQTLTLIGFLPAGFAGCEYPLPC